MTELKQSPRWQYLIARPHQWRRQLCIKGRNMTVGQLVSTVRANRYSPEQASEELELPLAAIYEALAYYAEQSDLIQMEASEERRRMSERGCSLEPKIYLDDCAYAKELVRLLESAGHQTTSPRQAGTTGREDEVHFRFAADNGLILG